MWTRYVALGDSTVEGLDDPTGDGGYRGWADRLAEHLAAVQDQLSYANLAVRGKRAGEVRREQLPAALALEPDLVAAVAGLNDVLRPHADLQAVRNDLAAMFAALRATGATVVTFTMPDPAPVLPLARVLRRRLHALNAGTRAAAERYGVLCVDLDSHPVASDPRLWSPDRLHANAAGHARIAAALAHRLGLPGSNGMWQQPLEPAPPRRRGEIAAAELAWSRRYLLPWLADKARGRSAGDGITPKRPGLEPVRAAAGPRP